MTNAPATTEKKKNALDSIAGRLQVEPEILKKTLKATVFRAKNGQTPREVTDEEFMGLILVANEYRLNPILREIYAFVKDGAVIPIVAIDGWIKLVNSNAMNDGVELIENFDKAGKFESVTAKFYMKGRSNPVVVTEYLAECQKSTEPWTKWPKRMLRHKAYIQGARVAYGFSGIYDEDEAHRIIEAQVVETRAIEMPRRTADAPQAAAQPKVEEPPAPATDARPLPPGFNMITAIEDSVCKAKECGMPIKKGEFIAFDPAKGIFHLDCAA